MPVDNERLITLVMAGRRLRLALNISAGIGSRGQDLIGGGDMISLWTLAVIKGEKEWKMVYVAIVSGN